MRQTYSTNVIYKPAMRYRHDAISRELWLAWIAQAPLAELLDLEEHAPKNHCVFAKRVTEYGGNRARGAVSNSLAIAFYERVRELGG